MALFVASKLAKRTFPKHHRAGSDSVSELFAARILATRPPFESLAFVRVVRALVLATDRTTGAKIEVFARSPCRVRQPKLPGPKLLGRKRTLVTCQAIATTRQHSICKKIASYNFKMNYHILCYS